MEDRHVHKVLKIQRKCFDPEYRESESSYHERIKLFPEGNAAIMIPDPSAPSCSPSTPPSPSTPGASKKRKKKACTGFKMCGYILAQPYRRGQINDVDDVKGFENWIRDRSRLPRDDQDCIYIHEISMHPCARGKGLTLPLVQYTERIARKGGFKWMSLVSLGPALGFWKKNGYVLVRELDYGGHTCYYMEKNLSPPSAGELSGVCVRPELL